MPPAQSTYNGPMPTEMTFVVNQTAEGRYTARALGDPITVEAETLDALRERIQEAVLTHFDEAHAPTVIHLHMSKVG